MAVTTGTFGGDARVIGLIGTGHFLSHFYIFTLPPLFPILKQELGVGYGALGLAVTAFNVASGLAQIPVGFLVDRFGARRILVIGLVIEALAFIAIAVAGSYWGLIVFVAVAGAANSVYHPADYAILSARIGGRRMGRAFSLHTFAGYAGNAAAPIIVVTLATLWDWRVAVAASGLLGIGVAGLLTVAGAELAVRRTPHASERQREAGRDGVALLLSPPILLCFLFFTLLAMSSSGINSFAVAAFVVIHDAPIASATLALTGFQPVGKRKRSGYQAALILGGLFRR